MSSLISPGLTASARKAINRTLPDDCVISRTGLTLPCRVSDSTGNKHIEGMPRFMSLPRWKLKFPAGADVKAWDEATVTDRGSSAVKGVYLVTEDVSNQSYNFSSVVYGIASRPSIVAETQRRLAPSGGPSEPSTYLASLTLRFIGDYLLFPVSDQEVLDRFGGSPGQVHLLYANAPQQGDYLDPTHYGEPYPVMPNDVIVVQDTRIFTVRAVQSFAPLFLALYVTILPEAHGAQSFDGSTLAGLVHRTPGGNILLSE